MDKKMISALRERCECAREMTDEEINQIEDETRLRRTKPFLRVWNSIEQKHLRREFMIGKWPPGTHLLNTEHGWLFDVEELFVDWKYGPCCIWARAVMEHILQVDCLKDLNVHQDFKMRFYQNDNKNPKLKELEDNLKAAMLKGSDCWSDEEEKICKIIADNGDYVVHHRLDMITRGKTAKDFLREYQLSEEEIEKTIVTDQQDFVEHHRNEEERRMAMESLKGLYRLFSMRRAPS